MAPPLGSVARYLLLERLGDGGFATVYRAHDPALQRDIALKLLQPRFVDDPDLTYRFVAEGHALARVRHRNVVQVFDAGTSDAGPYLAMELVDGASVAALLAARGALSLGEALTIATQAAAALDAVHAGALVHRDVKPANLLVERASGRIVLLDFGVSRALDAPALTLSGALLGTPAFLAPEYVRGEPCTPRSDIYQLAATVYQVLSGRPPFAGPLARVLDAVRRRPPPALGDLVPNIPPGVAAIVMTALDKDPARRPAAAGAFAALLERASAVAGDPAADTIVVPAPSQRHPAGLGGDTDPPPARQSFTLPAVPAPSSTAVAAQARLLCRALLVHPFDARLLPAGFSAVACAAEPTDDDDADAGIVGAVTLELAGPDLSDTIKWTVFASDTAAQRYFEDEEPDYGPIRDARTVAVHGLPRAAKYIHGHVPNPENAGVPLPISVAAVAAIDANVVATAMVLSTVKDESGQRLRAEALVRAALVHLTGLARPPV